MDGKDYSAVPPPTSLTSSSKGAPPLDFKDALSKAKAIAEKLKQQSSGAAVGPASLGAATAYSTSGTKRGYSDDDRDDYRSSSYGSGSYQDDHDSKRNAYDSGSSRPSYGNNESRRYGLGSEERKPSYGHYGGSASAHQEDYSVPSHMVGLLIGKGGENLKKIERMSGVSKVQFANDTSGPERQVHLTGEPDQISIARDMIRQMVEDAKSNETGRYGGGAGGPSNDYAARGGGGGGGPHQRGGHSATVTIPIHKVGLVIGRGGETIRDFEERSKARIMIQSEGPGDSSSERTINIVGEESNVQHAKNLIEDIVFGNNNAPPSRNWGNQQHPSYGNNGDNYGQHQQQSHGYAPNSSYGMNRMGRPDDENISVKVPSSAVGLIIGRGGENVKALQDQSGARVKVDPSTDRNAEERAVIISGDPKCVAIAKQLVEEKVQEAANRHRGGGGYNNRGGYRSQDRDYNNQQSGYGAESGGYDYSQQQQQYNQYYAQYGYGQNQYGQAGQDSSNAYQQYPGYQQYNTSYGAQKSEGDSTAPAPPAPGSSDENRETSDDKDEKKKSDSKDTSSSQMDPSAYYAQYYGNQQQMTPEQQQAYYQWYQQYYGTQQQQYSNYDQSQQNSNDPSQQQQNEEEQRGDKSSDSNQQCVDDVDGEPIEDNAEGDKADSSESSKKAQTD